VQTFYFSDLFLVLVPYPILPYSSYFIPEVFSIFIGFSVYKIGNPLKPYKLKN